MSLTLNALKPGTNSYNNAVASGAYTGSVNLSSGSLAPSSSTLSSGGTPYVSKPAASISTIPANAVAQDKMGNYLDAKGAVISNQFASYTPVPETAATGGLKANFEDKYGNVYYVTPPVGNTGTQTYVDINKGTASFAPGVGGSTVDSVSLPSGSGGSPDSNPILILLALGAAWLVLK